MPDFGQRFNIEGQQGATFIVVPSSASLERKNGSNWICDGVADDVEIQAAIDSLPSGGGKVMLGEGTFNIAASVVVPDDVAIEGMGMRATRLLAVDSLDAYVISTTLQGSSGQNHRIQLLNFEIDANRANQSSGGGMLLRGLVHGLVENVWIQNCKEDGILCAAGDDSSGDAGFNMLFRKCNVTLIDGNGINMKASEFANIAFCTVDNCSTRGIWAQSTVAKIMGTVIGDNLEGIAIGNSGIKISGCFFELQDRKAIVIPGGNPRAIVTGNDFRSSSQETDGGYEHINLDGEDSIVAYNTFHAGGSGQGNGNDVSHAVEEQAGGDNNLVYGNQFLGTWGTAAVAKVGSGTKVRDNRGWVTENSGTATLVNGQTSIAVTHGLAVTPVVGDVMVTPIEAWGTATEFWISAYSSTTFTITVDADPGQDVDFAWKAVVL